MLLTNYLSVQEYKEGKEIYSINEDKQYFHIVIRGKVKLSKKNQDNIANWDWALSVYRSLLLWKEQEFDKKVNQAMQSQLIRVKLTTNVVALVKIMNHKYEKRVVQDLDQDQLEQEDEFAKKQYQIQSKMMNQITNMYLQSQSKIQKEKER